MGQLGHLGFLSSQLRPANPPTLTRKLSLLCDPGAQVLGTGTWELPGQLSRLGPFLG